MSWVDSFDLWFATTTNNLLKNSGNWLTPILKAITVTGNSGIFFIVVALCLLAFKKTRRAGCCAAISMIIGLLITNLFLKIVIARPRPYADTTSVYYDFWTQAGSMKETEYSFPSGHTTVTTAFSVAIFFACNKKWSWALLFVPILMGFSRIYFGVHFASDVLGGLLVGCICGMSAYMILRLLEKTKFFYHFLNIGSITKIFKGKNKEKDK